MDGERRVLVLDAAIHRHVYQPLQHWSRHISGSVDCFRVSAGEFPQSLDCYTHAIVTGSEESINLDLLWIVAECEFVRELAKRRIPILGSCFGHQLVVRALSGKRFVQASPTPEFGWIEVLPTAAAATDPVFSVLPVPWLVFSSHFDEVAPLPDDWEVLASSAGCRHAAIRWRNGPIWGLQHHPEINVHDGEVLLAALQEMMLDKAAVVRSRLQAKHRDSQVTAALVRAFLAVPGPSGRSNRPA